MVDPGRVELPIPPCHGGVLPLYYGPLFKNSKCPGRDSNPHARKSTAPQAAACTNFATWA